MKKKWIAVAVLALVVLLVAAAFATPYLVNVDAYRGRIEAAAEAATGRKLEIKGELELSVLPRLALSVRDIALSNAPGAAEPKMLSARRLVLDLKLLPLLRGAIAVNRLVLEAPLIELGIDKAGRPNWQLAPPAAGDGARPIGLAKVSIEDGRLILRDERGGGSIELERLSLSLKAPDLAGAYHADGRADYAKETVGFALDGKALGALFTGAPLDFTLALTSPRIAAELAGTLAKVAPLALEGRLRLDAPSLRDLAQWLGRPPPAASAGFGAFSVQGKLALAGAKFVLSDATLRLDNMHGTGSLAIDGGGARPQVTAKLELDRIELNPYLGPAGLSASPTSGPAAAGPGGITAAVGWNEDPIDLALLDLFEGDFSLAAGSISFLKLKLGKAKVEAKLKGGTLDATVAAAGLYGGSGHGRIEVDFHGAAPLVKMSGAVEGVDAEPLLEDAIGYDKLSGRTSGELEVSSSGRNQRALVQTSNGKGKFVIRDGTFRGVDLGALVSRKGEAGKAAKGPGTETTLGSASGSFVIRGGLAASGDLDLKGPSLSATGAGTIDLPRRSFDYRLQVKPAGGPGAPVAVTGAWDTPGFAPELPGAAAESSKAAVKGVPSGKGTTPDSADVLKKLF